MRIRKFIGINLVALFFSYGLDSNAQCVVGNCANGEGKYVWPTGDSYEGGWKRGRQEGLGKLIANSTIKDYMGAVKSKHTLLITDACFGGSIFKSRSVDAVTFLKVHELYKDPSKRAMTSGNLSEVPDKSVFIDQLLKKLNENEDDYLPSQKLFTRIYEPVSNNATEPQFGVIQGAGDEGGISFL